MNQRKTVDDSKPTFFILQIGFILLSCGLLTAALAAVIAVPAASTQEKTSSQRTTFGPFWTTEEGKDTLLILNNPDPKPRTAELTLFSHDGRLLSMHEIQLDGTASETISFEELTEGREAHGHFALSFAEDLVFLPAQSIVSDANVLWSIDLFDPLVALKPSRRVVSLASNTGRGRATVVLSNRGTGELAGSVRWGMGQEKRWRLDGHSTRLLGLDLRELDEGAFSIAIESDRASSGLLTAGYWEGSHGEFVPLRFKEADADFSGLLTGFFTSQARRLLLHNGQDRETIASVRAKTSRGPSYETELHLAPLASELVDLEDLGVPPEAEGALSVLSPIPLKASVIHADGSGTAVPLKDPTGGVPSHVFPVRLGESVNTRLLLHNPDDEPMDVGIFLHFGGRRFAHPLRLLQPDETAAIDLAQVRDDPVVGQGGEAIPQEARMGLARILQKRGSKRKLASLAIVADRETGRAVHLQSCPACPPHIESIFIPQGPLAGPVGGSVSFSVKANYSDSTIADATFECTFDLLDPSIGFVFPGSVSLQAVGSTSLKAQLFSEGGFGGEMPAQCFIEIGTPSTQEPVRSRPPLLSADRNSVTRGESATFTIRNLADGATISNWRFEAAQGTVTRSSNTSSEDWSGTIVAPGTVRVTVVQGGRTFNLSRRIEVTAREGFAFTAVEPVKKNNGFSQVLTVSNPPTSSNPAIGFFEIRPAFQFFIQIVNSGPNKGFKFVTRVNNFFEDVKTTFFWVISEAAETPTSEFYLKQCGDYDKDTNPMGFISGAQLRANTIHHESADAMNSHYFQYRTAQDDSANNLGTVAEAQVAAPSTSQMKFINGLQALLTEKSDRIVAATVVEPCGGFVTRDGANNCTFNGFVNFIPYRSCN